MFSVSDNRSIKNLLLYEDILCCLSTRFFVFVFVVVVVYVFAAAAAAIIYI